MKFSFVEEVFQVRFVSQRNTQNLQDFIDTSIDLHIVFYDWNLEVSTDGNIDLYPHSVLRSAPKLLYLEVLLEPLEEQFYLQAILVEFSNNKRRNMSCIRKKYKLSILLRIIVTHKP